MIIVLLLKASADLLKVKNLPKSKIPSEVLAPDIAPDKTFFLPIYVVWTLLVFFHNSLDWSISNNRFLVSFILNMFYKNSSS